jgi:preprotein translocase subunit SecF
MRWRNVALVLSLIATVASLAFTAYRGLNLGVDFVGGQLVRVTFPQPVNVEQLRAKVDAMKLGEASIQEFGSAKTVQIRLPKPPGGDAAANVVASRVKAEVEKDYPGARIDSVDTVSGKVSEELADNSAIAVALAMLGIAIYIWIRFEWQFGVGALLTLAHDIAMTLGFFAFTRLQVDLNVVAAFLTIVGYSLNDTVVIYDRIRENLRKYRKMAILPLLNLSLNETLARTVVTSFTVLIALGVLMLIGPEVIFGLAIAIFLGVVIGTYSSIYISSPVLVWLGVQPDSFLKGDEKEEATEAQPA